MFVPDLAREGVAGGAVHPASARLDYRPVEADDLPGVVALHSDPRVTGLLVDGIPDTLAKGFAFLAWNRPLAARGYGTFAVRRKGADALIGLFSLTPFDEDDAVLELGGKLAPSAWAGGLAVEAGAAMIRHAFGTLARDRLVSAFDPAHRAAPAALARLGFAGAARATLFERDVMVMHLSREVWEAQGAAPRPASRCDYGGAEAPAPYPIPRRPHPGDMQGLES